MGVDFYRSTDSGAPVLDGVAGSLVNLLTKCLVDGYGAKSPLGWARTFSATNRASYRAATGNRYHLQVDDDASLMLGGCVARVSAWETLSALDTGTYKVITSDVRCILKSNTANSVARTWAVVGDEKFFYLVIDYLPGQSKTFCFGEVPSFVPADPFCTFMHSHADNASVSGVAVFSRLAQIDGNTNNVNRIFARSYNGVANPRTVALNVGVPNNTVAMGSNSASSTPYPNPAGNRLMISPEILMIESISTGQKVYRGKLPGFRYPLHPRPLADYSIITNVEDLGGRSLLAVGDCDQAANDGQFLLDITGPWR